MKSHFAIETGFGRADCLLRTAGRGVLMLAATGLGAVTLLAQTSPPTALDRYVAAPDAHYSYTVVSTNIGIGQTTYVLDMTSQAWLTTNEVNRTLWKHWVIIVRPNVVTNSRSLLFISGGSNPGTPPPTSANSTLLQIALDTGSVVTELKMVPNEPLTFAGEGFSRTEDYLITYTWDKFLRTGDEKWPARLPMTKAAVRAMDTVTSFCASPLVGGLNINRFVVSGASKRGWTTWTTAAVDPRVVAIIPASIDVLNVGACLSHHYSAYGFWAPSIQDYYNMDIMDWMGTPQFQALMDIEDPYSYRARLTMPKFEIWGAGDQYFLPDSSQFYFNDLPGVKYMRCIPNVEHSLNYDAYVTLEGCYQSILFQTPLPQFSWTLQAANTIRVVATDHPTTVTLWQAVNSTARDFRLETIGPVWTSSTLTDQGGGVYLGNVTAPSQGWKAFFVELTYTRSNGLAPLKFTTQVYVVPDILPFNYTYPPPNYLPPDYPQPNDNFTNATKVASAGGLYPSNSRFSTLEPGEPQHAGAANVWGSLWWTWVPAQSANVLLDTAGSTIDTALAVYTGNTLATLIPVAAVNDVGSKKQAYLNFNAQAGQTYRIAVASVGASSIGYFQLRVNPGGQHDATVPQVWVNAPLSGTTVTTNLISIAGTALDPAPNVTGVRSVLVRLNGSTPQMATGTTSWTASVSLQPGFNVIAVTAVDAAGNTSPPVTTQVNYLVMPVNDIFANALALTGTAGDSSVSTTNATKEVGEPNHAGNEGGKSVWWTFQPSVDGVLTLGTTNSSFDTLLALYTGTAVNTLTSIASNDDAYDGAPGGFSSLTVAVRSNQVYHIAVDGFDGASGMVFLHYTFTPATVYSLTISSTIGGSVTPSSGDVVSNSTVLLTATPDQFFEFDSWTGSFPSSPNPLAVVVNSNINLTAHFRPASYSDDFETGNLLKLNWTTGGNSPWLVQSANVASGNFAASSGVIGDDQSSSLILTANFRADVGSFYFKVSSEPDWDFLSFSVDGVLQQQWSGEIGWTSFMFPLPAGTHTLEWRYAKDAFGAGGLDAAFIDNVNLPFSVAILQLLRQLDGSLLLQIPGQPNQPYVIQGATNLIAPIVWQDLSTNIATGGMIQFVDPGSATNPIRFYRTIMR